MFKYEVSGTPFTSNKAELYFKRKIVSKGYHVDDSLVSTIRALLFDVVDEEFRIKESVVSLSITTWKALINSVRYEEDNAEFFPHFSLYIVPNFKDNADTNSLEKEFSKWKIVKKFTELFKKQFTAYALINEELKSTVVICLSQKIEHIHLMQSGIIGIMPYYFNTNDIDEDKKRLALSLRQESNNQYLEMLDVIAKKIDFRSEAIRQGLADFTNQYDLNRISTLERLVQKTEDEIDLLYQKISDNIAKRRQWDDELFAINERMNSSQSRESEIVSYFIANKHLSLEKSTCGAITYITSGYLTFFNEDAAEEYINNKKSVFYDDRYVNKDLSTNDKEILLRSIFIDRTLKIKMCVVFKLDSVDMKLLPVKNYWMFPSPEFDHFMPNPHINEYKCDGNFKRIFAECMIKGDFVRAIDESIVSSQSLNLGDYTVLTTFLRMLSGNYAFPTANGSECIELPDGRLVNCFEAVRWLKENSNE